jgi:putative heme-binding domain-containing protein
MTCGFRPRWNGALMESQSADLEVFAQADGALFRPTDLEVGPDGALYVLGWGRGYGADFNKGQFVSAGRVFRITHAASPLVPRSAWRPARRDTPHEKWTFDELIADLGQPIPAWRVNAQRELVRRGPTVTKDLLRLLERSDLPTGVQTWAAWALGRIAPEDRAIDEYFAARAAAVKAGSSNLRLQAIRILAYRVREFGKVPALPEAVAAALQDEQPRVRFEAVQAVWQARQRQHLDALRKVAARETDRLTFYAAWGALRDLAHREELSALLQAKEAGLRRAALLALADLRALNRDEVLPLRLDEDQGVAEAAGLWLAKVARVTASPVLAVHPAGGNFVDDIEVAITAGVAGAVIRYTLDGRDPTAASAIYPGPIRLAKDATLKAALFREDQRFGPVVTHVYRKTASAEQGLETILYNLSAASKKRYQVADRELTPGRQVYTDRKFTLTGLPDSLRGAHPVLTANDDAGSQGDRFLSFSAADDVTVYLAHDVRAARKPQWMQVGRPEGFRDAELEIATSDTRFRVYQKEFSAGRIVLGGNTDDGKGGGISNYLVLCRPALSRPRDRATTVAQALPLVETGDVERGRRLFFAEGGAGCARCHRIDRRGNNHAPDLSDVGVRADAAALLESILDPSAKITEGFRTQLIATTGGKVFSGIVLEESGLVVKLVPADGKPVEIDKQAIVERQSIDVSAMPGDLGKVLGPRQAADLAAFLLSCRKPLSGKPSPAVGPPEPAPAGKDEVRFEQPPGKVIVRIGGQATATYVSDDPKITRPYFAHLHAPGGTQVTRNHPPQKGDAADHADFHPGLWLAFGDLSGHDSWRLKAKVVHDGFVEKPQGGTGRGSFAVRSRYLSADGKTTVCTDICRCTFHVRPFGHLLVWESTFSSDGGDFTLGEQEEMGLGVRVATPLAVSAEKGGRILDSAGRRNGKVVWGRQAEWCDYSGPLGGAFVGVLLMPDPKNTRRCWWHARDYGLLAANPSGSRAAGPGEPARLTVKKEQSLRLRFGVLLHASAKEDDFDPAAAYRDFVDLLQR